MFKWILVFIGGIIGSVIGGLIPDFNGALPGFVIGAILVFVAYHVFPYIDWT
jgi:hypothetical protein